MRTRYWIMFGVLSAIVICLAIYFYVGIDWIKNRKQEPVAVKVEKPIPVVEVKPDEINYREIFINHGSDQLNRTNLGIIFDKLVEQGNKPKDIAFYDKNFASYFHDEKNVYWTTAYSRSAIKLNRCELEDFDNLSGENFDVGVCGSRVFVEGVHDSRMDGETIGFFDSNYISDKSHVYFRREVLDKNEGIYKTVFETVEGKPEKFTSLEEIGLPPTYHDSKGILYYETKSYPKIDLKTLKKITDNYYSDKNGYYYISHLSNSPPIFLKNLSRFEVLKFKDDKNISYVRIGNEVYLGSTRLSSVRADSLRPFDSENRTIEGGGNIACVINCVYTSDGISVYYKGRTVNGANAKTFKLIGYGIVRKGVVGSFPAQSEYARDKSRVYYKGSAVAFANADTFTPINSGPYYFEFGKDKNNVYFEDQLIAGADPKTFKPLAPQPYEGCRSGRYSVDEKSAYYRNLKIKDSDPLTFKVIEALNGDYAKDKNNTYNGYLIGDEKNIVECAI